MEFRQLESFCAVVRYQRFTKAAEKLYISQPTISTHIRMLEQEFNSRLIIRTTKNIEITPHGKELFACAQKIFTLKNDLIQKVVRIEMKDEKSQLKKKDERIRELESVIASLTLHNICLQSYVDVVNENISEEEKKTSLSKLSPEQRQVLMRLL